VWAPGIAAHDWVAVGCEGTQAGPRGANVAQIERGRLVDVVERERDVLHGRSGVARLDRGLVRGGHEECVALGSEVKGVRDIADEGPGSVHDVGGGDRDGTAKRSEPNRRDTAQRGDVVGPGASGVDNGCGPYVAGLRVEQPAVVASVH